MIGEVIDNDEDFYFTIAYILMTSAIVGQVLYYTFVIYSYQMIKRKIMEKGRLLQIAPVISIAAVCIPPNCSAAPQAPPYPGSSRFIYNKEVPPPYIP